jgi:ABC-type multidrug transport system fused ATPase/permease subunit
MFFRILRLFTKKELYFFFLLVCFLIISAILEVFALSLIPFYVKLISKSDLNFAYFDFFITELDNDKNFILFSLVIVLTFFSKNIFQFFLSFLINSFIKKFTIRISSLILNLYLKKKYIFFINNNSSTIIRNLTSELDQAGNLINSFLQILKESAVLIGLAILIFFYQTIYSVFLLIFFTIITYLFYLFFRKKVSKVSFKLQSLKSIQIKIVNQIISSIDTVKIMNLEKFCKRIYLELSQQYEKNKMFKNITISSPRLFLECLGIALVISVSCVMTLYSDNLDSSIVHQLTLLAIVAIRILPAYNSISSSLLFIRYNVALLKILPFKKKEYSQKYQFSKYEINNDSFKLNIKRKDSNFLIVKDVTYRYPDAKSVVLNKFNLKINSGDFVGITGSSGSGKSTLIHLIMGLLKPNSGVILNYGNNINSQIKNWQSNIGYIAQDIFLIDDTIKKNIAFGIDELDIDNKKVIDLLKKVNIINNKKHHKNILNFKVGEFGKKLSGGQKQRLAIARALYRDPNILIFDEATSALDLKTERIVMHLINKFKGLKTILFISHKLNLLKNCDKIIKI